MAETNPGTSQCCHARLTAQTGLHCLAVLTVLFALPLLFLGAEVTTKGVGMVDPDWPTSPLYLFLEGIGLERGIGFLIEHGHRLAGWIVGLCVVVLAVGLWRWEPRIWVRWLGLAALVGVSVQGLLGGIRILWNSTGFALLHGCFGQIVFALLVSLAMATSRRWRESSDGGRLETGMLRRWSLIVVGLLIVQLIFGALVRHQGLPLAQRLHLLTAFAVAMTIVALAQRVRENSSNRNLVRSVRLLHVLLGLQIILGIEAWLIRAPELIGGIPTIAAPGRGFITRDVVRSLHVLVGAGLLATATAIALETSRTGIVGILPAPEPMEEAA